jgi:hypothetical protein
MIMSGMVRPASNSAVRFPKQNSVHSIGGQPYFSEITINIVNMFFFCNYTIIPDFSPGHFKHLVAR